MDIQSLKFQGEEVKILLEHNIDNSEMSHSFLKPLISRLGWLQGKEHSISCWDVRGTDPILGRHCSHYCITEYLKRHSKLLPANVEQKEPDKPFCPRKKNDKGEK